MNDAYVLAFRTIVQDTNIETGFMLPDHLEAYIVMLLAEYMERPNFLPERSFIEAFYRIENKRLSAKELGDTCLFLTGVFPTYGRKYGLDRQYFTGIGINSYTRVAMVLRFKLFDELADHFDFLSKFIERSVHPENYAGCATRLV